MGSIGKSTRGSKRNTELHRKDAENAEDAEVTQSKEEFMDEAAAGSCISSPGTILPPVILSAAKDLKKLSRDAVERHATRSCRFSIGIGPTS
jgi:hypothetical protein